MLMAGSEPARSLNDDERVVRVSSVISGTDVEDANVSISVAGALPGPAASS
jgi:hypothetical protein